MSASAGYLQIPQGTPNRNSIALVNLILRHTPTRITVIQMAEQDPDPELFVLTSINWRDMDKPILPQLPTILSFLETMRGTRGVPSKVYLDSDEGLQLYIPTSTRASEIPHLPRDAVRMLRNLVENTCDFVFATANEVEATFWNIAMKRGFSPDIVERMAVNAKGFDSSANVQRFQDLLQRYFSIRFRIHTSESMLQLEETNWKTP
ncbi:MAG: hypothetical protein P1Q69_21500 [Candidatus Thorarchaeota archaeon]|nr:hypothetical protein [Candidatus Thorarchaeota archaeon]